MRRLLTLLFMLLLGFGIKAQSVEQAMQDQSLEDAIQSICRLIQTGQYGMLNDYYVHDNNGVVVTYRIGAANKFKILEKVQPDFPLQHIDSSTISKSNLSALVNVEAIYTNSPAYDCEKEAWTSAGQFIDTSGSAAPISGIMKHELEEKVNAYSETELSKAEGWEAGAVKVTITDMQFGLSNGFVFYLVEMDDRWYIFILDTTSTDCSA